MEKIENPEEFSPEDLEKYIEKLGITQFKDDLNLPKSIRRKLKNKHNKKILKLIKNSDFSDMIKHEAI